MSTEIQEKLESNLVKNKYDLDKYDLDKCELDNKKA